MPSLQSTLDEGGVAEELAESQRAISIAEFFEKNKHMLGFDSGARGLVTAVKEAVDNALDATEEAGHLPDIYVEITEVGDYYRLVVEDNGPGITAEQLPKVFGKLLYGSRFHKREQSLTPDQRILVRRNGDIEFVPIGVLCDAYLPKEGAGTVPVPDDIEVPSFTRDDHELSWEPLTHAIRHETDERTFEVETRKGRTVELTGNHSVFGLTETGETTEMDVGQLDAGDTILAPRRLPRADESVEAVNILEEITPNQVEGRRLYVYGFDRETLEDLRTGETVRRKPSPDSSRERYYYRYDGVEILRDSLEQNYLEKGYLPAETVLELGWEEKATDCTFRTYQVGGDETSMPVSVPVDESFLELIAHYISEGHVELRQVGFTFGSHESELISATEEAVETIAGSVTTVEREGNSTRVKAFGSPLSMFLQSACGDSSKTKRIPGFVFGLRGEHQQRFLAALYQGDGSDANPGNELSHTTTSETLARQVSTLWNMQGVLASTETVQNRHGYAEEPSTAYRTKVYGEDADLAGIFAAEKATSPQQYKRIPVSVLDPVRVGTTGSETVPDTVPGLLMGAGVGSSLEHATVYQSLIEDALAGEHVEKPRYVHNLQEKGLLDGDHEPTDQLQALWETIGNLHGFTDSDMCLLPVKSVTETDPPEHVYDISVPGASGDDENFVVANDGALSVKNSRGQQGIGISAAVLYSQLTSGKPAKITSRTEGSSEAKYFELVIDTDTNEPEIAVDTTTSWDRPHGTRIEIEMEANMRARSQLRDYIKHTAVVNPHARIELREPSGEFKSERATESLPTETEEIRPHPHGVELGTLLKMLDSTDSYSVSGFLQEEFTRVGAKTATSVLDAFRDRHYGREMAWRPPRAHDDADVARAVEDAVANKGQAATAAFAEMVSEEVSERERVAHYHLKDLVASVAETVGDEHDTTFGDTVQAKAVAAAWNEITDDRASDLTGLAADATSSRKDESVVASFAGRLASKFEGDESGEDSADSDDTDESDDPTHRNRVTRGDLRTYVDRAADMTVEREEVSFGDTARENVVAALWAAASTVPDDPPKVGALAEDRDAASDLLDAMETTDIIAPPTDCLAPITDDLVRAGLEKEFDADFYASATRDAGVHGGDPFVVEAGIAHGGELEADGSVEVMRFANRVPLVYQRGACATTDVLKQIGWRNYGLDQPGGSGLPSGPAVLLVHVASTNVPFTSESKDAIANVPEIEDEIELAVREAARELKSYLNKRESMQQRRQKQDVLSAVLPTMAEKVAEVTDRERLDIEDSLARIMNNVLVERRIEEGTVKLVVENNSSTGESPDLTEIVSREPTATSDGARVVEMDGEWFVKWSPEVASDDEAVLEYEIDGIDANGAGTNGDGASDTDANGDGASDADDGTDVSFDLDVSGIEDAKLTVRGQ